MQIINNLRNFLQDKEYYIDIFDNSLHVYQYEKLISLADKEICLKLKDFILFVEGEKLSISCLDKCEILIVGVINNLRFVRWNII